MQRAAPKLLFELPREPKPCAGWRCERTKTAARVGAPAI